MYDNRTDNYQTTVLDRTTIIINNLRIPIASHPLHPAEEIVRMYTVGMYLPHSGVHLSLHDALASTPIIVVWIYVLWFFESRYVQTQSLMSMHYHHIVIPDV